MATILYKSGDTHEVNGIKCEAEKFDPAIVHAMLGAGWVLNPAELYKDESEDESEDELEQLKAEAKELGLTGYGNSGADRLRERIAEAKESE